MRLRTPTMWAVVTAVRSSQPCLRATGEGGAVERHQNRVDQAARQWEAMTLVERDQAAGALMPTPSVKASSLEIYARTAYHFDVNGANFLPEIKLLFDPPLQDKAFRQLIRSSTQISVIRDVFKRELYPWRTEPGPIKVVAIDLGASLVQINPEEGGVVVAMVKADVTVQEDESLLIYQSSKQVRIAGSGFEDDMEVVFWRDGDDEGANFTVTDTKPDQLTLSLAEGSTWIKDPFSLPRALLVQDVVGRPGHADFEENAVTSRPYRKVATVFEDPSIRASDAKIYRRFTHELVIRGTGFNRVAEPILGFDPPLDPAAVNVHLVNRTMICVSLSTTLAGWTADKDYVGPLKVKEVDTGAGVQVFDSPVTVATIVPNADTQDDEIAQNRKVRSAEGRFAVKEVAIDNVDLPSVKPSSGEVFMTLDNGVIFLKGTNFNLQTKLYFNPTLPEEVELQPQFISSTEIAITRAIGHDGLPVPWRAEPGSLKLIAIDTGAGVVKLNPEDGGVAVATVRADAMMQDNESLHVYQSTKHIQVAGGGFQDIKVESLGPRKGDERLTGAPKITISSPNLLTLSLDGESSVWIEDPNMLPDALEMTFGVDVAGFNEPYSLMGYGYYQMFKETIATVFEDPTVDASDVEIHRTDSRELVIRGTGFNDVARQVFNFDPPLDSSNFNVKVVNRTMIELSLDTAQPGWVPVDYLGPLKIKGMDTGAGMVTFDLPATVAIVAPGSEPRCKQGTDVGIDGFVRDSSKGAAAPLHEAAKDAESHAENCSE